MKKKESVAITFADSKVNSCKKVQHRNGRVLALGFSSPPKLEYTTREKLVSVNHLAYRYRCTSHAGMSNKPLEVYSPEADRSKLLMPAYKNPQKNVSQIELGIDKKSNFVTMAQLLFQTPKSPSITNQGIVSEQNRQTRHRLWLK